MKKKALIFGITGQDGAYLSKFLLKKLFSLWCQRRNSSVSTSRLDDIYKDPQQSSRFKMFYGDLADYSSVYNLINKLKPDEIYNLAAQSHVSISFDIPEYTADINATGVIRLLEAIKSINPKINFIKQVLQKCLEM